MNRVGVPLACVAMLATLMVGCVTERSGLSGTPVKASGKSASKAPTSSKPAAAPASKTGAATLPNGPVAHPEPGKLFATNVSVQVQPKGSVGYDGQALPLVSPDGHWLAVQEGLPPSWETILAESGASSPGETRLAVYDLAEAAAKRMATGETPLQSLLLGRNADDEGFLVESPRPGGARWIGKVSWIGGRVTWLAQGDKVNAFGFLTPQGELLYSRRDLNAVDFDLVLRGASGEETVRHAIDGSYVYPLAAAGVESVMAFRLSRAGTELEALRVDRHDQRVPRLADTRQQWKLAPAPDAVIARQVATTFAPFPTGVAPAGTDDAETATLFDPRRGRMARFSPATGGVEGLLARTIAAVASTGENITPGYFCTSPGGLVFIARPSEGWPVLWPDDAPVARVLAAPYVATPLRADESGQPRYLLVGPVKTDPNRLEITRMTVVK